MTAPRPETTPYAAGAERTRLAWRRTILATTTIVLLTARLSIHRGLSPVVAVGVGSAMIGWIALLRLSHRRIQAMAHREPTAAGRTLPATAVLVVAFALLGIVLTITGPPG